MNEVVVIVGAGVAGINAATKLIDNNYKGKIKITQTPCQSKLFS